ncbi:hypothetical protein [Pseudalkalibacillus berkeleyi]|uniref:Uncharacterized protein n=1 Tax=Pseudalkalibacillus berkeleyi TaxID=1069813 RepID=A0ABS9H2G1_9BACL|nr:hypothetical protein [Pseudalkalibacillus berkeleyi]MCF6138111.1 hypothetical protein [Pseudalkalibacillus berkeleyi]
MKSIVRSNQGGVLVIVLMVIMVIGLLIPASYSMYNKLLLNDARIVHQKQAVNIAVSAMESFENLSPQEQVKYLLSNSNLLNKPLEILSSSRGSHNLYHHVLDKNGKKLTFDKFSTYSGEYTLVIQGVSGDKNGNHQKDPGESFYTEHEMKLLTTTGLGPGQHVYLHQDERFVPFDTYIKGTPYYGDITIFDVNDGSNEYHRDSKIEIVANGNINFKGGYKIQAEWNGEGAIKDNDDEDDCEEEDDDKEKKKQKKKDDDDCDDGNGKDKKQNYPYNILVHSKHGNIIMNDTTLETIGNSARRNLIVQAPNGDVTVINSTMISKRDIYLFAGWEFTQGNNKKVIPSKVTSGKILVDLNNTFKGTTIKKPVLFNN